MVDSVAPISLNASRERPASTASGYAMLAILFVAVLVQIFGIVRLANDETS